jgi:dihydroxyacid dehydratase/phosphogluconate dehydratase
VIADTIELVIRGQAVDIVSAFEAVGAYSKGLIDEEERYGIECSAIALLRDGDRIIIDSHRKILSVEMSGQELERRRAAWKAPPISYRTGALTKYARLVSSASRGAVTQ